MSAQLFRLIVVYEDELTMTGIVGRSWLPAYSYTYKQRVSGRIAVGITTDKQHADRMNSRLRLAASPLTSEVSAQ